MFKYIFGRMALIFSPFILSPVLVLAEEPVSVGQPLSPPSQLAGEGLLIPLSSRDPRSLIPLSDQRSSRSASGVLAGTSYGGPPLTPPSVDGSGNARQSEPALTTPVWTEYQSRGGEADKKTENRFWAPPQGFADDETESDKEPTDTVKPPNLSSQIWSAEPPSEEFWRLGDDGPRMSKGTDDRFDYSEPESVQPALPSYQADPVLDRNKDRLQSEIRSGGVKDIPYQKSKRLYGVDGLSNTPAIPGYRTGDRSHQIEERPYAPYNPDYNRLDPRQSGLPFDPDRYASGGEPVSPPHYLNDGGDGMLLREEVNSVRPSPYDDPGLEPYILPLPDPWRLPEPTEFDQSDQPPTKRPVWSDEGTEYTRPPSKDYDPFDYGDDGGQVEPHPTTRSQSLYDAPYGILEAPPEGTYGNQWR
ncbi:MAG: hypothetical protein HQL67_09480 [Magnetococcales bacterium]|nr:hypothetical protein [Magnetococcales bacterium]